MIRALAGQGLDSSTISILHFILSLLWVNYVFCDFGQSKTGVDEMIQYVPAIRVELMTWVDVLGRLSPFSELSWIDGA